MSRPPFNLLKRLRHEPALANFGWLSLDRIVRMAVSLLVGTWMARYLGPGDYGTLNYGLAVTGILSIVPTLGLDLIVRRRLRQEPENAGAVLGTAFLLKLFAGIITYTATVAGAYFLEHNVAARFVILMGALLHVYHALTTFDVYFQARLEARYSVWAQNLGFGLSSLGRVALILAGAKLEAFAIVMMLELPLTAGLFLWFYRRSGGQLAQWRWDRMLALRLLQESWPLAIAMIANLVLLRIDQVLLVPLSGVAEAGRYAAAARLTEMCTFLPVALVGSLSPGLMSAYTGTPADYARKAPRLFTRTAQLAWGIALPGMLLANTVVHLLYGPAFASAAPMFAVLMLGYPCMASSMAREQVLVAEGKPHRQLAAMLTGMVLNLGLNLLLIPRLGGIGSACANTVSQLTAGVLVTFAWRDTRHIARWQIRALFGFWRDRTTDGATPQA